MMREKHYLYPFETYGIAGRGEIVKNRIKREKFYTGKAKDSVGPVTNRHNLTRRVWEVRYRK